MKYITLFRFSKKTFKVQVSKSFCNLIGPLKTKFLIVAMAPDDRNNF